MSFESFVGFEGGGGMDSGAFEKFQEQMRENAAHVAALKKAQAAQQQKEDKLIKIILKFIGSSQKIELVHLVTQLLEKNVPAGFVLSLILLGNDDIQDETGIQLSLPEEDMKRLEPQTQAETTGKEIVMFGDNPSVLPLKVRISIDLWAKSLMEAALQSPNKTLDSILLPETRKKSPELISIVLETAAHVIYEFMHDNKVEGTHARVYEFAHTILKGIVNNVELSLDASALRASKKDQQYEE